MMSEDVDVPSLLLQFQTLHHHVEARLNAFIALEAENARLRKQVAHMIPHSSDVDAYPRLLGECLPGLLADEALTGTGESVSEADSVQLTLPRSVISPAPTYCTTPLHSCAATPRELSHVRRNSISSVRKRRNSTSSGGSQSSVGSRVFTDAETIKELLEERLSDSGASKCEPISPYKSKGMCQWLVRHAWFEGLCIALVLFSSFWIAVELDMNPEPTGLLHKSGWVFQVVGHGLCVFFICELLLRFLAHRDKKRALTNVSFLFDAFLVLLIVFENWIVPLIVIISGSNVNTGMKLLVVLRMLRVSRIMRLRSVLRHVPELTVIVRGIGFALKGIAVVCGILFLMIYIVGIALNVLTEGLKVHDNHFDTVLMSMGTLLLECTFSRGNRVIRESNVESWSLSVVVFLFVLAANITLMGVLTGLLVHTVKTTAEVEKEEALVRHISDTVDLMWNSVNFDTDGDGLMSEPELMAIVDNPTFQMSLERVGVDMVALLDVSTFVFEEYGNDNKLDKKGLKKVLFSLRGNQPARVKDHVETRKHVRSWMTVRQPE
eukprot:TRINITY_DN21154_c0_g1_i1.p1 TRINITY_DN21154_c0_g1~~TRINITY_DN21154_c0_g1_i1.p1  ORF type:complete len:559 (-),score=58.93 TRINITY_DN21154_c0_g1_i1:173-1819(-)